MSGEQDVPVSLGLVSSPLLGCTLCPLELARRAAPAWAHS